MIFRKRRAKIEVKNKLVINDTVISMVKKTKFLGVYIDENLLFKEAPYNFFKPMPSSLIGARWLRHSLPYTTIPRLYPDVRVFMAPGAFD